jgi:3-hydroxyisobutyrate dehydrogenase
LEAVVGNGATTLLGELTCNLDAMNKQAGRGGPDFSGALRLLTEKPGV